MCERKAVWVIAGRDGFQPIRIWDEKWGAWRGQGDEWGGDCAWLDWASAAKHAVGKGLPVDCVLPAYLVTEPGEQKVKEIQDPTQADAWGVRVHTTTWMPWRASGVTQSHVPIPLPKSEARRERERVPACRYIVPLRVTESEPTTRIELHEAAQAMLDHGSD